LNFLNNLDKVYFRKRIGDTTTEVTKLVHLDKITFKEIDTPSTIEEYVQILNFLNNLDKVYFRKRIGDTTIEVTKLVHLDKISQYRTTNGSFKWKLIEAKLKIKKR
jgi:hypothetical protein